MRSGSFLFLLALSSLMACAAESTDSSGDGNPQSQEGAWDAESADHEEASTHLWIVNRGIEILGKHADADPVAKRVVDLMNDATCQKNWHQGLLDADFKAVYNNGNTDLALGASDLAVARSGATWKSHFFDPDTGKNYKGETSPTAYTESTGHLRFASEAHLETKSAHACYELGLALHYYTDLTQPMHAANFTAVNEPAKLHSNLEGYAMEIQARYPLSDWSGVPTGSVDDFIMKTARDSKPLFMAGVTAVVNAYRAYNGWRILECHKVDVSPWRFIEKQHLDIKACWEGNPGVDAMVGNTLKSAQDHTAQFLYLVGKSLPEVADPTDMQDPEEVQP